MEQGSLSSHENSDKACHLFTSRNLVASFGRGLIGEFQGLHEGMFVKERSLYPAKHQKEEVCVLTLVCYHFTDGKH